MEEIMDTTIAVLNSGTFITAFIATLGWVLRSSIKKLLDQNLANYKSELALKNDTSLELFKSTLNLALKRDEVSIQWLHQKRANMIQDLYSALVDLGDATQLALFFKAPSDPKKEREEIETAYQRVQETYVSYRKARILFTEGTCTKMKAAIDSIGEPITTYLSFTLVRSDEELRELHEERQQLNSNLGRTLPKAMETLEEEFRTIIGTIEESNISSAANK
jgi:hypothetical protein